MLSSRRLEWFGHAKLSQGCIKTVMDEVVEVDDDKTHTGRSRKTSKQCVDSDMKTCKLKWSRNGRMVKTSDWRTDGPKMSRDRVLQHDKF